MVELSKREIKICHLFLTVLNYRFNDAPQELKESMLGVMLSLRDIKYDEEEMIDLVQALNAEQELLTKASMKALWEHKDSLKGLKNLKLFKF